MHVPDLIAENRPTDQASRRRYLYARGACRICRSGKPRPVQSVEERPLRRGICTPQWTILELPRGPRPNRSAHFSHALGGSLLTAVQQSGLLATHPVARALPSTRLLLNNLAADVSTCFTGL